MGAGDGHQPSLHDRAVVDALFQVRGPVGCGDAFGGVQPVDFGHIGAAQPDGFSFRRPVRLARYYHPRHHLPAGEDEEPVDFAAVLGPEAAEADAGARV